MKIQTFVDDHFVEAPGFIRRVGVERCLDAGEGTGWLKSGASRARGRSVAELVVGRHLAARRDQRDVVRERLVVADVAAAAVPDRVAIDRHRELRLARAGGADHAQAKRSHSILRAHWASPPDRRV